MSLRWKLPLAALPVLAGIVIGVSTVAYVQIRRAAAEADRAHLESAGLEVARFLEGSLQSVRLELRPVASDARTVRSLAHPSSLDSTRAIQALQEFRSQHAARYMGLALCSAAGRVVAQVGSVSPDVIEECRRPVAASGTGGAARITPLRAYGDTIGYALKWWVDSPSNDVLGVIVAARALGDPSTAAAVASLVGPNANVLLGNADGTLWTNFSKRVPGPLISTAPIDRGQYTRADGRRYVGARTRIAASPWVVWVESPTSVPIAVAREFIGAVVLVGVVLMVGGAIIISWLVRRSLRPLDDVASAATAMAIGVPAPLVPVNGARELASLAYTFNTMADQVEGAAEQLRNRADDLEVRNRELREREGRYRQLVDQSSDGVSPRT